MLKYGFVKLDRSITSWRWYANANTARVFIHLLLIANYEDREFENLTIRRGQAVISYDSLCKELKLTFQQARTALAHLKSTGEITSKAFSRFQVITITNYNLYQDNQQAEGQPKGRQRAGSATTVQQADNNNVRKIKKDKEKEERKEGTAAQSVLTDERGAPPEDFSTWEAYYDWLSE